MHCKPRSFVHVDIVGSTLCAPFAQSQGLVAGCEQRQELPRADLSVTACTAVPCDIWADVSSELTLLEVL